MARNQGRATRCQIPDKIGQPYIIATIPPPQAGENEVAPESLFRTFAIIIRKLKGLDTGRRIIYDGDLIHKFFGVTPENALTAIILVMGAIRYKYTNIEIQISERLNKLITKEKNRNTPLQTTPGCH